jgi:CBS domain-containing protein
MTSSLVRDVMTTEVVTAEPSTPFKEIAGRLAQHRISAVPVVDVDRRVLGIVTEADLLLKQEHPDPRRPSPSSGPGAVARNGPKRPRQWPAS